MNKKLISIAVMKLYLYADICKMIHYSAKKWHEHEQADNIRDCIIKFADSLAEQSYGFLGRPNYSDFSLRVSVKKSNDLTTLCNNVMSVVEPIRIEANKNSKYSGIVSMIDDFKGELSNHSYLNMFDGVSNERLHEAVDKVVKRLIK